MVLFKISIVIRKTLHFHTQSCLCKEEITLVTCHIFLVSRAAKSISKLEVFLAEVFHAYHKIRPNHDLSANHVVIVVKQSNKLKTVNVFYVEDQLQPNEFNFRSIDTFLISNPIYFHFSYLE